MREGREAVDGNECGFVSDGMRDVRGKWYEIMGAICELWTLHELCISWECQ